MLSGSGIEDEREGAEKKKTPKRKRHTESDRKEREQKAKQTAVLEKTRRMRVCDDRVVCK